MNDHFYMLSTMGRFADERLAFLEEFVSGLESEAWRVHTADALSGVFPADARIRIRDGGDELQSLLGNSCSMLIVSQPFQELIARHAEEGVELLPLIVCSPKRRVLARDYFLVNPLVVVDCIDLKRSKVHYSRKNPGKVLDVRRPMLDRRKLKKAPQLFRMEHMRSDYVVGPALAEALRSRKDLSNVVLEQLRFASR